MADVLTGITEKRLGFVKVKDSLHNSCKSSSSNDDSVDLPEWSSEESVTTDEDIPQVWLVVSVWSNELRSLLKFYDEKSGKLEISLEDLTRSVDRILNLHSYRIRELQVSMLDSVTSMYQAVDMHHKDSNGGNGRILLREVCDNGFTCDGERIELSAEEELGDVLEQVIREKDMLLIKGGRQASVRHAGAGCRVIDLSSTWSECYTPVIVVIVSLKGLATPDGAALLLEIVERGKEMQGIISLTYRAALGSISRELLTTIPEGMEKDKKKYVPFFPVAGGNETRVLKLICDSKSSGISSALDKTGSACSLLHRYCSDYSLGRNSSHSDEILIDHHQKRTSESVLTSQPIRRYHKDVEDVGHEKISRDSQTLSRLWQKRRHCRRSRLSILSRPSTLVKGVIIVALLFLLGTLVFNYI